VFDAATGMILEASLDGPTWPTPIRATTHRSGPASAGAPPVRALP